MNEQNLPENTLRSWRLRRPAARLKRQIFKPDAEPALPPIRWLWGSLAPAMACVLMAFVGIHRENENLLPARQGSLLLLGSNQPVVVSRPEAAQSSQNHLAEVTFDWTNRSVFQSSMPFALSNNLSK
jgi:hypothetical protein